MTLAHLAALAATELLLGLAFKVLLGVVSGGRWGPVLYCPECGLVGQGKSQVQGSLGLELALWLALLLPGLLYSVWRLRSGARVCASCHYAGLLPLDSPQARARPQPLSVN